MPERKVDHELHPVLGIDLGTTFSSIARWDGRGPNVYQMRLGGTYRLQSAVYYDPATDEFLVGDIAFRRGMLNPENLALGVKRHMDDGTRPIVIGGKTFTPIELSARILQALYNDVNGRFPKGLFSSRGTVVTVPYYFKAHQCENTRLAARMADIECIGILQEPIAASLSYAWKQVQEHPERECEENILVFDLGGGTFDLTLFALKQAKDKLTFEVLGTDGDDRLGGMDFDAGLVDLLLRKSGISLAGLKEQDKRKADQNLIKGATEAKLALSFEEKTHVAVPYVLPDKHIDTEVCRKEFNDEVLKPYVERIESIISRLLATTRKRAAEVHRVIPAGGSSFIPRMKQLLAEHIGADKVYEAESPTLCVVEGAALYSAYLDDPDVFGRELDVQTRTCHALGVETMGGRFAVVIPANRKAPFGNTMLFANSEDNVTAIDVEVYQGSKPLVKDNSKIGTVKLTDLPPRPRHQLDIEVTFKVSGDQQLSVGVKVKGPGVEKPIEATGVFQHA